MTTLERTLVLVKPDGMMRGIAFEVLARLERAGYKPVAAKIARVSEEVAKSHYVYEDIATRRGEFVWKDLVNFIRKSPVLAVVFEGVNAVAGIRKLCGSTEPAKALAGTIRGDYAGQSYPYADPREETVRNVVHASSDLKEAEREIAVWFSEEEIHPFHRYDAPAHLGD